jgi:hypothetical protein
MVTSHKAQPPTWSSWELTDLSELEPDSPPWASLDLSAFGNLSRGPACHLTVPRTIWSEWTWFVQSPLACCKIPLESLFRTVHGVLCIYFIFLHSNLIRFFSFVQLIFHSNALFIINFQFLKNIVRLSFSILILEMSSWYFDPIEVNP